MGGRGGRGGGRGGLQFGEPGYGTEPGTVHAQHPHQVGVRHVDVSFGGLYELSNGSCRQLLRHLWLCVSVWL